MMFCAIIMFMLIPWSGGTTCKFCQTCESQCKPVFATGAYPRSGDFVGSNSLGSDLHGEWTPSRGQQVCRDEHPVVSMQFVKSPYMPSKVCVHWSLLFEVRCNGTLYPFAADFTEGSGLRRRFGHFAITYCAGQPQDITHLEYTLKTLNATLYTPLVKSDYRFFSCNCHDYVDQMWDRVWPLTNAACYHTRC